MLIIRPDTAPRASAPPAGTHRPTRSNEEEESRRRHLQPRGPPKPRPPPGGLDIFASPPRAENRRPRRNSDSSIMDKDKAIEDEKRRRERRKEREARREKDGKSKDGKSSKPHRKPQGLDLIDQLDVTGIYGQGRKSRSNEPYCSMSQSDMSGQSSTTMGPLMPATPTVTVRRITVPQCRLSRLDLPTTHSVVPAQ